MQAQIYPEMLYTPDDPALRVIAKKSTMSRWRCEGRGPPFIKISPGPRGRILYRGADILAWLGERRVGRAV